jgi:hypothetical protein
MEDLNDEHRDSIASLNFHEKDGGFGAMAERKQTNHSFKKGSSSNGSFQREEAEGDEMR